MSRVAKNPVVVPSGVEVALAAGEISIKGPMGTLKQALSGDVSVVREGDRLLCKAQNESTQADAMSGTNRAQLANMVLGVSKGFERKLNLVGVGFRAQATGQKLNLQIGFSHPVVKDMPEGIKVECDWKVGSPIVWSGEWEGKKFRDEGVLKIYERPRLFEYTYWTSFWGPKPDPDLIQTIRNEFLPAEDGTKVVITQKNIPTAESRDHSAANWKDLLDKLAASLG